MSGKAYLFSLKFKLLLVSLAVLVIPLMGFDYLRQMESYLRDTLEATLVDTSFAIAGGLNNQDELFNVYAVQQENSLYIHELDHTVQMDGYTDDWMSYLDWADTFHSENKVDSMRLIASSNERYFYLFMQVYDDALIYAGADNVDKIEGDHLILVFTDAAGVLHQYYFVPTGPGLIRPFRYEVRFDEYGIETRVQRTINNIAAVWQPVEDGYNIEITIPVYLVGEQMGFILRNYDGRNFSDISTAGDDTYIYPNRLLRSSRQIENIILTQGRSEGRRTWVLDKFGQVLASDGSLQREFPESAFNILYRLLLPPAHDYFTDDLAGASRLKGSEVTSALSGKPDTRWRSSPDGRAVIVSAATPIWFEDRVVGAVVVEETTNNIQLLQRQVLANLFNKTLLMFILVVLLLILFAGRLSTRLIRLNRDASAAIDAYGRVQGTFIPGSSRDEIGELSRSFGEILGRLQQYHQYLEGMAGSLSHELKTPMAIVQSSLEQLQQDDSTENRKQSLESAATGLKRLQSLLTRLSEAASLEHALQEAEKETTDLNRYLQQCVAGYRLAYPEQDFVLNLPEQTVTHEISPELFYQMLDKLISNAVDFSSAGKPISIELSCKSEDIRIRVINHGPLLPVGMANELFNSMVSVRKERRQQGPHLGLGLFIARLIADYHQARLSAHNLEDESGVCIIIKLQSNQE